jgi:hypothetical protein
MHLHVTLLFGGFQWVVKPPRPGYRTCNAGCSGASPTIYKNQLQITSARHTAAAPSKTLGMIAP